ncbi:39S ribosomal protein L43, mitochondrial-like isoform X2 [Acanthaster planci]|uniref:Large ribosomal subunit protein mL43 n=1 Tax=Acanthaster planci TaxID=133434 RepID=A0A8B7ZY65_ACAPL|nr:39S ribosomal protein L43, mitochondrial-like isoform X2 [Acanthaster planci]
MHVIRAALAVVAGLQVTATLQHRDFVEQDIVPFAEKNPQVVLYVTPHSKYTYPKVVAEFLNGTKRKVDLNNLSREDIIKEIELLRTQSGLDIVRIRKQWHTDNPSIQGYWHPFYNKPTELNIETFPSQNPTLSEPRTPRLPKLTEKLIDELKEIKDSGKYRDK